MTKRIDTQARIEQLRLQGLGSAPSSPDAGYGYLYYISGANPGIYFENHEGEQIGPFITGSPAASASASYMEVISTETLGSDGSFADVVIPTGTYSEIIVRGVLRTADAGTGDRAKLRFGYNGVLITGSNYAYTVSWLGAASGGSVSQSETYISSSVIPGDGATSGYFGTVEWTIFDPTDVSQWRRVHIFGGNAASGVYRHGMGNGWWKNTTNDIALIGVEGVSTVTFKADSRLTIIGVKYINPS